jgi:hypothetical protein
VIAIILTWHTNSSGPVSAGSVEYAGDRTSLAMDGGGGWEEYLETIQEDDDRGFVGDALKVIGDHQLHAKILSKKSLNPQNQSD